jgi:hypothetical protein
MRPPKSGASEADPVSTAPRSQAALRMIAVIETQL